MSKLPIFAIVFFLMTLDQSSSEGKGSKGKDYLNTGGAISLDGLVGAWADGFAKKSEIRAKHAMAGSAAGLDGVRSRSLDVAFVDLPLDQIKLEKEPAKANTLQIPVGLAGVVPVFNVEGMKDAIRFTGPLLADIFLGKIKRWNDPEIKRLNPKAELPDCEIHVLFRQDNTSTTLAFTEYLCLQSMTFKKDVGSGTKVKWPIGKAIISTEGLSSTLAKTPGAISFAEFSYAQAAKLPQGAIKNKGGAFVVCSANRLTSAAAQTAQEKKAESVRLVLDADGKDSFPICTPIWAVVCKTQPANQNTNLISFIEWILGPGQSYLSESGFAPLPSEWSSNGKKLVGALISEK